MPDRILTPEEISALTEGTTKGPWRDEWSTPNTPGMEDCGNAVVRAHHDGLLSGDVAWLGDDEQSIADARLIAAAPDLARTALAAMAVARRLADRWMPYGRKGEYVGWSRHHSYQITTGVGAMAEVSDHVETETEPMTDDEARIWAAIEGASDG